MIHARGQLGGPITPDPHSRDLNLSKRVIGVPGDTVVGRNGLSSPTGRRPTTSPLIPSSRPISGRRSTTSSATTAASRRTAARSGQYHERHLRPRLPHLLAARTIRDSGLQEEARPAGRGGLLSPRAYPGDIRERWPRRESGATSSHPKRRDHRHAGAEPPESEARTCPR